MGEIENWLRRPRAYFLALLRMSVEEWKRRGCVLNPAWPRVTVNPDITQVIVCRRSGLRIAQDADNWDFRRLTRAQWLLRGPEERDQFRSSGNRQRLPPELRAHIRRRFDEGGIRVRRIHGDRHGETRNPRNSAHDP